MPQLYEVVRTSFSADFLTFRNFRPQFGEACGATWQWKWELSSAFKRAIPSEKNGENRVKIDPKNRDINTCSKYDP